MKNEKDGVQVVVDKLAKSNEIADTPSHARMIRVISVKFVKKAASARQRRNKAYLGCLIFAFLSMALCGVFLII